jgi:hypothetical protein
MPVEHIDSFQWMRLKETIQEVEARGVADTFRVLLDVQEGRDAAAADELKDSLRRIFHEFQLENFLNLR